MISKYKEIINYLIFGILTTIIYLVSYYILTYTLLNPNHKIELQLANILSWIISVTFAYITNKIYVFESKNQNIIKEAFNFYISRITTLFIDMILMYIFVTKLQYNDKIIKLIVSILIIIINYILSKIFIFKEKQNTSI